MPANDSLPSHESAWMMVRNHSSRVESHPCDKTRTPVPSLVFNANPNFSVQKSILHFPLKIDIDVKIFKFFPVNYCRPLQTLSRTFTALAMIV